MSPADPDELLCVSGLPAEIQNRGASSDAWALNPRSMFSRTWTCPWGYRRLVSVSFRDIDVKLAADLHETTHNAVTHE